MHVGISNMHVETQDLFLMASIDIHLVCVKDSVN